MISFGDSDTSKCLVEAVEVDAFDPLLLELAKANYGPGVCFNRLLTIVM